MKQKRDEFRLRLSGVGLGKHRFSIFCDKKFFDLAEITEIIDGSLSLDIEMEKKETMLQLSFHFYGEISLPCARCLEPVAYPLDFLEYLTVKFSSTGETNMEDDTMWIVPEKEYDLDIFHFVYEAITLAIPLKITHAENNDGTSNCNQDFINQLEKLSIKDLEHDPRWDALKNIKIEDN